jgi:hypothetical protein
MRVYSLNYGCHERLYQMSVSFSSKFLRRRRWLMLFTLMGLLVVVGSLQARQYVTVQRLSVTSQGLQADGGQRPALSADGRFVSFWSDSPLLVGGDTNNTADIFVRDIPNSQLRRVSIAAASLGGAQSNGLSYAETDISDTGIVVYASDASNLITAGLDTNNTTDIFAFDLVTNEVARISVANGNTQVTGRSRNPVVSTNGLLIAYRSEASTLVAGDSNGQVDIFVFDRTVQQVARVNVDSAGAQSNLEDGIESPVGLAINGDGSIIAFESKGSNLVGGDSNGVSDIFIRNRVNSQTNRISVATGGGQSNGASTSPSVSDDGRYIAFASTASNLVAGDTNGVSDIFLRDRQTDTTIRISLATGGGQGNNNSTTPTISGNGRYISFWSAASNLVEGDTNNVGDIFVHDAKTGTTSRVSVDTDGVQANNVSAFVSALSNNGDLLAFESAASNLVANDTNNKSDVFLARAAPDAPTNLVAVPLAGSKQIQLTWQDKSDDETKFQVERSANGGQTWEFLNKNLPANTEAFVDTTITACGTFAYRVYSANDVGRSSPSNVATATTFDCPPGPFTLVNPAPNSTIVNPLNVLTLNWTAATEATTYVVQVNRTVGVVEQILSETVNAATICNAQACALPVDDDFRDELTNGNYQWVVQASNSKGSTNGTPFPATFVVDTTQPPRNFTLGTPGNNAFIRNPAALNTMTWQFNPDAASYRFVLFKGSDNPRDIGVVADLDELTSTAGDDPLACNTSTCTLFLQEISGLKAQLTTGTYIWNVEAITPGEIAGDAANGPFQFTINTNPLQLVVNGGFEAYAQDTKIPANWTLKDGSKDKVKCNSANKTVAFAGLCAFMFKGGAGESAQLKQDTATATLGLGAGDTMKFSGYFNGSNVPPSSAYIQVNVKYTAPNLPKEKVRITLPPGTYAYTTQAADITIDGAVEKINLKAKNTGQSGKFYLDNVSLVLQGFGGGAVVMAPGAAEVGDSSVLGLPGLNTSGGGNSSLSPEAGLVPLPVPGFSTSPGQ